MRGHIQLHRSMLGWEWYDDKNTSRLFIHLLLVANWKPEQWHGIPVRRGQRLTSYAGLAKETGLSVQSVRTSLNRLKSTGEITCKTTTKYTVITINNYDKYQSDNTQANNQVTHGQHASNMQVTTNEESNKAISTTTAATRESQLKRLCQFYEANSFGMIPRSAVEEFGWYLDDGLSVELIERCMKEAVDCGKANWKYTKSILGRCKAQVVSTPAQFDAQQQKAEAGRANKKPKDNVGRWDDI